jgi:uncharacterized protein involved in exopolysaccharide biosynthesis
MSTADQLQAANARLTALEQHYKPEHPDVIAARRTVNELSVRLEAEGGARNTTTPEEPVRPANPTELARQNQRRSVRAELAALVTQIGRKDEEERRLTDLVASYRSKVDAAPTRQSELVELTRDYTTLQNSYTSLLAKHEEAKIAANLEKRQIGEQFKILDPARVAERPFSPNRLRLNAIGAIGGLAFGVALVVLFEYRDRSLKTADDLTTVLQLPVLALIPMIASPAKTLSWRRRGVVTAAVTLLIVCACAAGYVVWTLHIQ